MKRIITAIENADLQGMEIAFRQWAKKSPGIEAVVVKALVKNPVFSSTQKTLITAAAKLAAEKNDNPYHGNRHFLEVFCFALALGMDALRHGEATSEDLTHLLTAALIHDYKHDGKNNGAGENHVQFRLEDIAYLAAEPHLIKAGASSRDLRIIRLLVRATDVSKSSPTATSPAASLKNYLRDFDATVHPALDDLRRFGKIDLAMMMHDADLASGTSLSHAFSMENGTLLAKENGWATDPESVTKDQKFFLEHIFEKQAFSRAGRHCLSRNQNRILQAFGIEPLPGPTVP